MADAGRISGMLTLRNSVKAEVGPRTLLLLLLLMADDRQENASRHHGYVLN